MNRLVVIANPVASQFTGGSHRDVMSALSSHHVVEAVWPSSAPDASQAAADAAADGVEVVVAMGGDGMVHHVAQGLVGTSTALAIIPVGTTNVIARLLDIPSRVSRSVRLLARPLAPTSIGVVRIELARGDVGSTRYAIFACGAGFDAEVVQRADSDPYRKYRFGSLHYARSAVGVALGRSASRKQSLAVHLPGSSEPVAAGTALVQFREVYTYFGRIPIRLAEEAPSPMTVLTQDRMRRRRIPRLMFDAMTGRDLGRVKGIRVFEGVDVFEIRADPPTATQADGERFGLVDSARFTWLPSSLRVVAGG